MQSPPYMEHNVFIASMSWSMLCREVVRTCCKKHTKLINAFCEGGKKIPSSLAHLPSLKRKTLAFEFIVLSALGAHPFSI